MTQMLALWIPALLTSIFIGLAFSDVFSGAFLVIFFGSQFIYFVVHYIALGLFIRTQPPRPMWQFVTSVLGVQLLISAGLVYAVVA